MRRGNGGTGLRAAGTLLAGVALACACGGSAAQAASVAYVDDREVWLSSLDGAAKVRLSAGEAQWLDVAQADGGRVIGVRNEPGKIAQLSRFTIWEPDGSIAHEGPLPYRSAWAASSLATPLSVDLTADGRAVVFGYSSLTHGFPVGTLAEGFIVMPWNNGLINTELTRSGREWPTIVSNRVVATSGSSVQLQNAEPGVPYTENFTPWFTLGLPGGAQLQRADVAANASAIAWEIDSGSGPTTTGAIDVAPLAGGLTAEPGYAAGCRLPTAGSGREVSLSQDGSRLAWRDGGGVKVAGIPVFNGADACQLSAPPVVISATGSHPSIGGADAAAIAAARAGAAGGGGGGGAASPPGGGAPGSGGSSGAAASAALGVAVPARPTAAALRTGLAVTVTAPGAGLVTVTLSVPRAALGRRTGPKSVVIARGSARAARAGRLTVRLKATKQARPRLRRLRGKTGTLKVTAGTRTVTKKVKLR